MTFVSPGAIRGALDDTRALFVREGAVPRLLAKDPTLFAAATDVREKVAQRLGWVDLPLRMPSRLGDLASFVRGVHQDGFTHALLLGMGGSSLAPLVFSRLFPRRGEGLDLTVLDSSAPDAVRRVRDSLPLERTLVIVSSKSGTTAEPNALKAYFRAEVERHAGRLWGRAFAAITDPGTPLADEASAEGWRRVFENPPDIGGRYSALSLFGLVPLALMGHDPQAILASARSLLEASGEDGGELLEVGALLGGAAVAGRDKVTFVSHPELDVFGLWLEQLFAESTGKEGKGLLPVALEPRRAAYGSDRLFVGIGTGEGDPLAGLDTGEAPAMRVEIPTPPSLGREMMRFEVGVALAGVAMGINPFDEPNVAESKANTERILKGPGSGEGVLGEALPAARADAPVRRLMGQIPKDGYLQIAAYLDPGGGFDGELMHLREALGHLTDRPVTSGYGPRFLHSTGQYHKGGPPVGAFIQLVAESPDEAIPGSPYGFGTLIRAQAEGDREALSRRRFPLVAVNLGKDPHGTLDTLIDELLGKGGARR